MPTYEYACDNCHNEWEFEQSIKEDPIKECPRCHEQKARRQISRGGGFILKGGGWYSDLYSSPSNKPSGGDDKPTGTKPAADAASTSTSSDSSSSKSESSGTTTTTPSTTSTPTPGSGGDGSKGSAAAA
jgi:putative FmdB family regulatory protein